MTPRGRRRVTSLCVGCFRQCARPLLSCAVGGTPRGTAALAALPLLRAGSKVVGSGMTSLFASRPAYALVCRPALTHGTTSPACRSGRNAADCTWKQRPTTLHRDLLSALLSRATRLLALLMNKLAEGWTGGGMGFGLSPFGMFSPFGFGGYGMGMGMSPVMLMPRLITMMATAVIMVLAINALKNMFNNMGDAASGYVSPEMAAPCVLSAPVKTGALAAESEMQAVVRSGGF